MWVMLCVLSLAKGSGGQRSEFPAKSETVSMWAATASNFFGHNPAELSFSGVVSELKRASEVSHRRTEGRENDLILGVLRLLGVDSRKVKDLAFDGIVSLVHLLGQILLKEGGNDRRARRAARDLPMFHFILRQPQVAGLLKQMRDPELMDTVLSEARERVKDSEEDAECILALICKTSPFVRGMQRSLEFFMKREAIRAAGEEDACPRDGREEVCWGTDQAAWEKADTEDRMFFFFPSLGEVAAHGDDCDQRFPNCVY